jgi:hypothetical protein
MLWQVQAIIVHDVSRTELSLEPPNKIPDEEVFISQLHRRARLLDSGFQTKVWRIVEQHSIPPEPTASVMEHPASPSLKTTGFPWDQMPSFSPLQQEFEAKLNTASQEADNPWFSLRRVRSAENYEQGAKSMVWTAVEAEVGILMRADPRLPVAGSSRFLSLFDQTGGSSKFLHNSHASGPLDLFSLPWTMSRTSTMSGRSSGAMSVDITPVPSAPGLSPIAQTDSADLQSSGFHFQRCPSGETKRAVFGKAAGAALGYRTASEALCYFKNSIASVVGVWPAPVKAAARMKEKLAEYVADGAAWPRCAQVVSSLNHIPACSDLLFCCVCKLFQCSF